MAAIDGWSTIKEHFGTDYIGALRHMRDTLLIESDWTQFTDSPLTDSKKLSGKHIVRVLEIYLPLSQIQRTQLFRQYHLR